jgi:hypothetical protein
LSGEPHTPGRWSILAPSESAGWGLCVAAEHEIVARIPGRERAKRQANARLIAAAPDLLELARFVAKHFEDTDAALGKRARTLIRNVEGGGP